MKILSAINSVEELPALVEAGADELYCGIYEMGDFSHGNRALNRREGLAFSLDGIEEYTRLIEAAERRSVPVFLALNSFYSTEAFNRVKRQVEAVLTHPPAGIIAADIALLRHLKKIGYPGRVAISVGGTAFNSEAVKFYRDLGAARVVLPRQITLAELSSFTGLDVELEMILLEGRCLFVDGLCNFHHSLKTDDYASNRFLARKVFPWTLQQLSFGKARAAVSRISHLRPDRLRRVCSYRYRITPLDLKGERQFDESQLRKLSELLSEHLHMGACALCHLPALREKGISFLKISNRGMSTVHKVRTIRLARRAVDALDQVSDPAAYRGLVRGYYRDAYGVPCTPHRCYFAEG